MITESLGLGCNLAKGMTKCEAEQSLSLETRLGKWTIKSIIFQANAGSTPKELVRSGDLSFQVIPHGEIVLPEKVTVLELE